MTTHMFSRPLLMLGGAIAVTGAVLTTVTPPAHATTGHHFGPGINQTFLIPADVCDITVTLAGGSGGLSPGLDTTAAGTGAVLTFSTHVHPGDLLDVHAGFQGESGGAAQGGAGFSYGANAGAGIGGPAAGQPGGGGGGASALLVGGTLIAAAGGGGGGGAGGAVAGPGGGGGAGLSYVAPPSVKSTTFLGGSSQIGNGYVDLSWVVVPGCDQAPPTTTPATTTPATTTPATTTP